MQDLITQISESANDDSLSASALYDKYAPALYGRIIRVVKQKDIAEKILERVFMNALVDKNLPQSDNLTFFTTLINHSRKKTYSTLKALKILDACSCA
jgi:DNA-directed RNA polymerase specialized sigma24 family protein